MILSFLRLLGYDVENLGELKAEYVVDVGIKKREKIIWRYKNFKSKMIL